MNETRDWKRICLFATLQWLATIVPSSAYFQVSVGGFVFSIPGFNDAERRSQVNAQTWCNGNHSKLLEITSGEIQSSIVSFIKTAMDQNQITGNNVITNGKRLDLALTWVNGAAYSPNFGVKGQEPGRVNSYGYLNSTQSGFDFFVDSPISTRGYICEGSSFCANGFTINGRCYKSYSEKLSWFDARNRCTNGKGDLGSFEFIVSNSGFNALNGSGWNPPSSYWIGIARQKWTWQLSNADVVYSQWSGGHPDYSTNQNNECLCLLPNTPTFDWKWSECDCSQTFQFVCMTESPSSTTPSTTLTSSTTDATKSSSSGSSSSVDISRNTLSLSTAASTRMTPANSSGSGTSSVKDNSLAIGLGVGIGGGVLLIAVILVVVFVVVKRKGCPRKPRPQKQSSDPPDVTPESYYATVVKNPEFDDTATDANGNPVIPPPTEYADLSIVTVSPSPDQARRSIV